MNPLSRLSEYLGEVERRLRLLAISRGAAIAAGTALAFTVLGVILANYFAFSPGSVLLVRLILFLSLAGAVGAGLILPLLRLNRRNAAREVEHQCPHFEQRLVTFAERVDRPDPFLELLAADTLDVTRKAGPERIAPRNRILSFSTAGVASVAGLLWLAISGPGFLGYGTSLLWGAIPRDRLKPFYAIEVQPGNRTIRRKSDQMVTARLRGFQTGGARVFAKYRSSSKWEEAAMYRQPGSPNFEFLFTGVPESLDYRVEAAGVRSATYRLNVIDLPEVRKLRVTYHYPAWTALKDAVEDPGGDLRAVEGTEAEVKVETDRPLSNGALVLDDGAAIALRDGVGRVPLQKDGLYHVATAEHGEMVRLSNDYFIEVQKATPPTVRILRPGRDAKVNPIEEVTIAVEAQDDFGLRGIDLHYSVNGGPEKTVALGGTGRKAAQGSTTLSLEDYKLVPGDIVSFSATARNALSTTRSDIFFIEAQPFELEYRQSQQTGGAGGGQMPQVAERQKEIVAATWNQIKNPPKDKAAEEENARLLAGIQSKLRDQSKSLEARMQARELGATNPAFKQFAEDIAQAIEAMDQAVPKLRAGKWAAALPPEQKSLQHLLRAEAVFRNIQVAFGRGGSGAGGTGRDMEGLFDLELDREKNQFETGRNAASPDQRQKEIEEALAKLEELARRQQELAEQQRQNQQAYQQRWQQEMLRREAEELQRKMEQLTRGQSSSQARQGQQGQSGQGGQAGEQSQQSQQSQQVQQAQQAQQSAAVNRALERLTQAMRDMQNAGSAQGQGTPQSEAEARRAAERLREARDMLAGLRKQQAGEELAGLAQNAQKLAEEQRNFEGRMRQAFGLGGQDEQGRPNLLQPGTPRAQVGLRDEQQKLLGELTRLEQEMQNAARALAGSQRQASNKLREALGQAQNQELRLKMGWSFTVMRQGMGPYALTRQPAITQGLKELSDRLREAQSALNREQPGGNDVESALARAERLREQLERLRDGAAGRQSGEQARQGQQAQQSGQNTGSQPQASGRQPGQQGTNGAPGPGGLQGGSPEWTSRGGGRLSPSGGVDRGFDPAVAERTIREGVRDLGQIEQMLRNNHDIPRDVSRDILDAIRETQRINTAGLSTSPERIDQLISQLLGGVEQIELRLKRLAEEKQSGSVRSGASQPVPPGYAEAVAQYFRRLSKEK